MKDIKAYLEHTVDTMNNYLSYTEDFKTAGHKRFHEETLNHKEKLVELVHKLEMISEYKFSLRKMFEIGKIMCSFYEIYENKEYNAAIYYSFGFHGYIECITGLSENVVSGQMNRTQFVNKSLKSEKNKKNGQNEQDPKGDGSVDRKVLEHYEDKHKVDLSFLLNLLDGILENPGRIIIMTSNVGASTIKRQTTLGFGAMAADDADHDGMKDKIIEEAKRYFKPEFLNRLDSLVVFHMLEKVDLNQIVDLEVSKLVKRLKEKDIALTLSAEARDLLSAKGFDPAYGARPMRRAVACSNSGGTETADESRSRLPVRLVV
jgi:hypothetical protein